MLKNREIFGFLDFFVYLCSTMIKNKVMAQEDKELLLKDLCARLPYNTKVFFSIIEEDEPVELSLSVIRCLESIPLGQNDIVIKPYLRPMSSMTEEEVAEFESITEELLEHGTSEEIWDTVIDWLNAHHFDHRHLIEKGLALEAPEKIYVYIPDDDIVGTASIQKEFPHQFVTEEYTRTDAFIEKAMKFLYDYNKNMVKKHGARAVLSGFTINVYDFKKYMEE